MSANVAPRLATVVAIASLTMVAATLVLMVKILGTRPLTDLGPNGVSGLVLGATYPIVGWLIASRRPENRIGWIFLVVGLSQSLEGLSTLYASYGLVTDPGSLPLADFASWVGVWAWAPGFLLLGILVLLFPDGELPSPRWRPVLWIAGLALLLMLVPEAVAAWPYRGPILFQDNWEATVGGAAPIALTLQVIGSMLSLLVALVALAAVVARFRRSTGIERQQLKGVASAALAEIAMLWVVTGKLVPPPIDMIVSLVITPLVPVAIGVAIFRYRLYELDRLVSRTIAYAVLTGGLILVYVVVNLGLTALFSSVTKVDSFAVAASTLVVAALFAPVRRRVQRAVDRRFDRARFDAERTTIAFAERLRNEMDIRTVTEDLSATVQAAISPTSVGLWLRETGP